MTSAQVVETSVNVISNSPSQDYTHPEDRTLLYDMTPGFKPFTTKIKKLLFKVVKTSWTHNNRHFLIHNMAKIYKRFLSEIYHRERTETPFIPKVKTCRARMAIGWLTTCEYLVLKTFFFLSFFFLFLFYNMIELLWRLFQKMSCVFWSAHQKPNSRHFAIGTFIATSHSRWVLNKNALLALHSVCFVLFRDRRRHLKEENAMKSHSRTQT